MRARYVSVLERPPAPKGDSVYCEHAMSVWAAANAAFLEARQPTVNAIQLQRQRGRDREGWPIWTFHTRDSWIDQEGVERCWYCHKTQAEHFTEKLLCRRSA